jgi:hypothetical protein
MAKQTGNLQMSSQMIAAERSVDRARKAFENFLANAQATVGRIEGRGASVRASIKDINSKAIANAEKSVQASLNYAEALLKAKNLSEVMRLHGEFIERQMRELAEQSKHFNRTAARAPKGAAATQATHTQGPDLEDALIAARERGRARVADILNGEDMLSAEAFAELLGTTRVTVNTKRQHRQVLALEGAKRGFRFPEWQVGLDGKPFAVIPDLFDRLGGDAWAVYRFLIQHHSELDGLTAREALQRGKSKEVVEVAESVARTFA